MGEIQVDKKIYEGWIAEDIEAVQAHVPDGLTKKHIIAVLQESINLIYPKYKKVPNETDQN